jgi:hypothetical protein
VALQNEKNRIVSGSGVPIRVLFPHLNVFELKQLRMNQTDDPVAVSGVGRQFRGANRLKPGQKLFQSAYLSLLYWGRIVFQL